MSLTLALQSALSGLNATQAALQVTSNNIANVNTVGYTRKVAQFASQTLEGIGSGVNVARVSRQVDEFLIGQVRSQRATTGRYDVQEQFMSQLEAFFGSPASDRTISTALTELKNELEAVGLTPELDANRFTAVGEAKQLTQLISELARTVQQLRLDADNQITQYVGRADDLLGQIVDLNVQISRARATGTNDTDLRDQRDRVLAELSDIIDVKSVENQAGQLVIFTSGGQTLLSGALRESLSHSTAIQLGPDTYYTRPSDSGYPGAITGIFVGPPDVVTGSNDITGSIHNGRLRGLIELRDQILPNLQAELDQLTGSLSENINAIHNQGTAYPPPQTLTGTQSFDGADTFSATGTVRIAVLDSSGEFVDNGLGAPAVTDLALGGLTDINDVVTAINSDASLNGLVTASLTAGGKLQLTVAGTNGVSINESTSAVSTIGTATRGFSHYFGLNDMFAGSPGGTDYSAFASAQQPSSTTAIGGTGGNLTFTGNFANSPVSIAYTNAQSLETIAANINADADLTAANISARIVNDDNGRRLIIEDADYDNFILGGTGSLLADKGFGLSSIGKSQALDVKRELATSASLLARGQLNNAAIGGLSVGDNGVTMGDGTTAIALSGAFDTNLSFPTSGGVAATNMSLTRYAASINSNQAALTANIKASQAFNQQFLENLEFKAGAVSGVNLDEELSQLVILEQAYNAAARVITVTSQMFDELANVIR